MSERTLVPIFVFWAFLTIITPTLILLSENSKADFDMNGSITDRTKGRRMMGKPDNGMIRFRTKAQEALRIVAAEEIMSPSPAPNPYHDQHNNTDGVLRASVSNNTSSTNRNQINKYKLIRDFSVLSFSNYSETL